MSDPLGGKEDLSDQGREIFRDLMRTAMTLEIEVEENFLRGAILIQLMYGYVNDPLIKLQTLVNTAKHGLPSVTHYWKKCIEYSVPELMKDLEILKREM